MFAKLRQRLKGWKTILWNGFLGFAPAILVGLDKIQAIDLTQHMTWWMAIIVGVLVGGIGTLLRYITTGPVGSKGDEAPAQETKAGD
jgi:predicted cobalt transporter CbtA